MKEPVANKALIRVQTKLHLKEAGGLGLASVSGFRLWPWGTLAGRFRDPYPTLHNRYYAHV